MPTVRFYNTLTHRVEPFSVADPPDVYMYNCGPTVYDFQTIGNFRSFLFADLLRRFLELVGYRVHQVMNLTDVGHMTEDQLADGGGEDKMNLAIRRFKEAKKAGSVPAGAAVDPNDPFAIAQYYIDAFVADARMLGLKVAGEYPQQVPRATDHIQQMQAMIATLIDKGHAYVAEDGAVYYSVESFPPYGRLSGNTLDKLRGGAGGRILEQHQAHKRHPADFLLWKADASHIMKWKSPWGEGYPGWHIECSAMARAGLRRDVIDIHTGGEDNIFPHHECEIAQSCGSSGQATFARFWMHARHLLIEGEKMSKSKGNFYTVRDVLAGKLTGRPVDPAVLRFDLLKSHYRSNLNFTKRSLEESATTVRRIREVEARLRDQAAGNRAPCDPSDATVAAFCDALADDLNVAAALAALFEFLRHGRGDAAQSIAVLGKLDSVLGVLQRGPIDGDEMVADKCRRIDQVRAKQDFATADRLRQELIEAGYEVRTTKQGTTATRKLA